MIDVKLKSLLEVVNEGSFTRAAEKLSLSQPAVSYQLRQLEDEYSIKIFYQNRKNLTLTPEGQVLVKYARRLENISESAKRALLDCRQHLRHFTVGITPTVGNTVVSRVFATYCNDYPHTSISILTGTIEKLYDQLTSYELDFAIVEGAMPLKHCHIELLDMDYLCLVMAPEHRLAGQSAVSLAQLKKEKLILRQEKAGTRRLFESSLALQDESLRSFDVRLELDNVATIKELVAANMGVTVIAHSACREEVAKGILVAVPIEGMKMVREINVVYQDDFDHPEVLSEIKRIYASQGLRT